MENSNNEVGSQLPAGIQTSMWEGIRHSNGEPAMPNPFALSPEEELRRRKIAQHKASSAASRSAGTALDIHGGDLIVRTQTCSGFFLGPASRSAIRENH